MRRQITFLGHVISSSGIAMDPDKIRTLQNFQPPKNKKQIQSFLGFINFYRKYIRNLSQFTGILSQLTKQDCKWEWHEKQQMAFEEIKKAFLEDLIIQYLDFTKPFLLATDASITHVGAELYQIDEAGNHRTLGFASRVLSSMEIRYCTMELELLAVVFGCKKFRMFILGNTTQVLTDHKALMFLKSCRLLNGQLMRWTLLLQEYNLEIYHVTGKENIGVDTLTRYPQNIENQVGSRNTDKTIILSNLSRITFSHKVQEQLLKIAELQREDECIYLERLRCKPPYEHSMIFEDILFKRIKGKFKTWRVVIPAIVVDNLVEATHIQYGHMRTYKTYEVLKETCTFHNMYQSVKRIVKCCDKNQ